MVRLLIDLITEIQVAALSSSKQFSCIRIQQNYIAEKFDVNGMEVLSKRQKQETKKF